MNLHTKIVLINATVAILRLAALAILAYAIYGKI
jgi:hypothetical protein